MIKSYRVYERMADGMLYEFTSDWLLCLSDTSKETPEQKAKRVYGSGNYIIELEKAAGATESSFPSPQENSSMSTIETARKPAKREFTAKIGQERFKYVPEGLKTIRRKRQVMWGMYREVVDKEGAHWEFHRQLAANPGAAREDIIAIVH